MPKKMTNEIVEFLKQNTDIFAWIVDDMEGISFDVALHHLNVAKEYHPVKQ